jgi:hypothetical protein
MSSKHSTSSEQTDDNLQKKEHYLSLVKMLHLRLEWCISVLEQLCTENKFDFNIFICLIVLYVNYLSIYKYLLPISSSDTVQFFEDKLPPSSGWKQETIRSKGKLS